MSDTNLTSVDVEELAYYPFDKGSPLDPSPELVKRAAEEPVSRVKIWNNKPSWLITGFADVRQVLADVNMSVDARNPSYPASSESSSHASADVRRTILEMDEPEHSQFRRMLLSHFTVKSLERLRPEVNALVDDLLDKVEKGEKPFDMVKDFALPLTSSVICGLMGVSYALADEFHAFAELSMQRDTTIEDYNTAQKRIHDQYEIEIADARENPNDGLLSKLLVESVDTGNMTMDELRAHLDLIFIAGHDTTANTLVLGTLALIDNPDQADLLRNSDEPAFIRNAVEDLVRYVSVAHDGMRRFAKEDTEIDGQTVSAGDPVIVTLQTANRDPELIENPDRLDFNRRMQAHVGFGFGVHQCLGQNLARLELTVAFPALLRRFPDLRVAVPRDELVFNGEYIVYGMQSLPLTFGE